jgi:actin-related protein
VYDGVMECDADIRAEMFRNIVLAGGSTLFLGMAERLQREIRALTASHHSARQRADYPEVRHGRRC